MTKKQFSSATVLALVASAAISIAWFLPGVTARPMHCIMNDAAFWGSPHRLTTFREYLEWEAAIPDYAPGGTPSSEPPYGMNFTTHHLLIAPYPSRSSAYTATARLGGRLVILNGEQHESGELAQEIIVPRDSKVFFGSWLTWVLDASVLVACALAVIVVHRRTTKPG